ncbi:PLP-dependent enzyme, histidinol-phosphate/aromatic aminotransferase or cobyric acid decarboxylase [Photorhabdus temperata subsp. temperata Meg1]|uniref:PLP-dependent enzyme, histidinol-phosphate/aromatic aminotransferase or cobyric acid decarboxylase n=1 Tax=Photorhabdus temperata subsp. temperata Meg1 TaxID=1393735 RepID=A0A081RUE0_PHOTE|nr:PLP-dependent enzyme, histidinol-phosphate/aromatic aminotransferase or cobyric acid decarboxylase [Photorhabdus temperata subsp. temperata Meg1]
MYNEIPDFKINPVNKNLSLMEFPYQIKLDSKLYSDNLKEININRYPIFDTNIIKEKLCEINGVSYDRNILLGNGLLELIQTILLSFSTKKTNLLIPDPSFFMFTRLANICRVDVHKIPLNNDFGLDVQAFIYASQKYENSLIIIDNPNNPTGVLFGVDEIRCIVENCKCPVIIDEAYVAYSTQGSNILNLTSEYDNLIVLRGFSKIGFAGLRFGYIFSNQDLISYINKFSLIYSLCDIKMNLVLNIINEGKINIANILNIKKYRDIMINKISKLNNITVSRSQANFIFFSGSVDNINLFKNTVIKNGIKISTFPLGYSKITDNSVRLSVGDKLTNDIILNLILDSFY